MITFAIFISLAAGFALGCIYVLLRTRIRGDESDEQLQSLKQAAKDMIDNGNLVGLNPHKVYKFCRQYEQIAAESKKSRADIRDMRAEVEFIISNCESGPSTKDYAEDIYLVPHYMLLDILNPIK